MGNKEIIRAAMEMDLILKLITQMWVDLRGKLGSIDRKFQCPFV
jgi:hypothetical protein